MEDKILNYRNDWENLKIGDLVYTDSNSGFCTGGIAYGIGIKVINITDDLIITKDSGIVERWCRKNKTPKQPPFAYYLSVYTTNI
jgi:hypothetical protein